MLVPSVSVSPYLASSTIHDLASPVEELGLNQRWVVIRDANPLALRVLAMRGGGAADRETWPRWALSHSSPLADPADLPAGVPVEHEFA